MLFNSFPFLLAFLPCALLLHGLAARAGRYRLETLLLLSVIFYGYWDWRFVPLMLVSIGLNWLAARVFIERRSAWIIPAAITANLAVLAAFKYTNFFVGLGAQLGLNAPATFDIALPLGISFFTFHHIMYLVDLRAGRAGPYDLTRYALYIAFFPQVLAGPLVRWSEVMHQFPKAPYGPGWEERVGRGLILLTLGLAKKVLIGDPLAEYANPVFAAAAAGQAVTMLEAWQATLAFTFQIYFDFSGYTDMALGLGLLFGITLPQNFDVPYRATSLRDFWRRWHMTLSRFLRDYLYVPLGGNRFGLGRQMLALFATMTLGGLWHGAGLTFVAWGMAHGAGLAVGLLWRRFNLPMHWSVGWLLTFLFVMACWVLFRAPSFDAAIAIYQAMLGFGPTGTTFKWRMLVVAAAVALIGPTAWTLAHRLPPWRAIALALAVLFVIVLLKIGDDENYEFIYFQF